MSKRKYKILVDITLLFLCLLPLIALLIAMGQSTNFVLDGDYNEYINRFCISQDLSVKIGEAINTFGVEFDGAFYNATCAIIANAILIHIFYVFVAVLVFVPKFAVKLLNISVGEK